MSLVGYPSFYKDGSYRLHSPSGDALFRTENYGILHELSKSDTKRVCIAHDIINNRKVVLKHFYNVEGMPWGELKKLHTEEVLLGILNHDRIPKLLGSYMDKDAVVLVVQYIEGETLLDRFAQGGFPSDTARRIVHDLIRVLGYLHQKKIIHCAFEWTNVLISKTDEVYLIGLQHAAYAPEGCNCSVEHSTFAAPEMLTDQGYDDSVNLYALGIITYMLVTNKHPYQMQDDMCEGDWTAAGCPAPKPMKIPSTGQREADEFIAKLTAEKTKRPSFSNGKMTAILKSQFLNPNDENAVVLSHEEEDDLCSLQ
jgi:serine/threonine protein kinase